MRTLPSGLTAFAHRKERKRLESYTLEIALHELRCGAISFDYFVKLTHNHWFALAKQLHRKWKPPTGVDVADVYQDVILAAWQFVPHWDESRGTPIDKYVVWNAADKAKKVLHKQRGAKLSGSSDKNPTRSESLTEDGACAYEPEPEVEIPQEVLMRRYERAKALAIGRPMVESLVLLRLARNWSVEATALELYANPSVRLTLRLGCEEASRRVVRRVVKSTAIRIAVNAA